MGVAQAFLPVRIIANKKTKAGAAPGLAQSESDSIGVNYCSRTICRGPIMPLGRQSLGGQ